MHVGSPLARYFMCVCLLSCCFMQCSKARDDNLRNNQKPKNANRWGTYGGLHRHSRASRDPADGQINIVDEMFSTFAFFSAVSSFASLRRVKKVMGRL
jgi:hypothetical protein